MAVKIEKTCIGCGACVPECPHEALDLGEDGIVKVDPEKCVDCGKCLRVCPVDCIVLPPDSKVAIALAKAKAREAAKLACEIIKDDSDSDAAEIEAKKKRPPELADYTGGVWVFAEHLEGKIAGVTLELIGAAKSLAAKLDVTVSAVLLGDGVEEILPVLFEYGADKVYIIDDPIFHFYRTETYQKGLCHLIRTYKPEIMLLGASTTGRDLAGSVATDLCTGLTADCTGLDIDPVKKHLMATRPAFGGNIMATILCERHRPQMATVRPRVMKALTPVACRPGEIIRETIEIDENHIHSKVLEIVQDLGDQLKLEEAHIIVSGGRGLKNREGFDMISDLAEVVGGVVGGSRGALEIGCIEATQQIGQTGKTVAPKLYFAIGISGAVQHIVGMQGSEIIVAINKDPDCPMMKLATYAIVGDAFELVPALTEAFKKMINDLPSDETLKVCNIDEKEMNLG